jgi:hypothetical protein
MAGGYFGGQIKVFAGQDGGGLPAVDTIYNLIVAPAANGQFPGGAGITIQYKTTSTGDPGSFQNEVYGKTANDMGNDANHPAFQWARALNIGGFSDWYIPAKNELEILYYTLKPDTTANGAGGTNPNSVPARASNYTAGNPTQTTSAVFQSSGAEAFTTVGSYWSSTEDSTTTTRAWVQGFSDGAQVDGFDKTSTRYARAVRRVAA